MATRVKSVRASDATWLALEARAGLEGVSANVLAVRFIEAGLSGSVAAAPMVAKPEKIAAPKVAPKVEPAPKARAQPAATAQDPKGQAGRATPYGVRGDDGLTDKQRAVRALDLPPPDRPAYGANLKGAKRETAKAGRRR